MVHHTDEEVATTLGEQGKVLVGETGTFDGWLVCLNCGERHDAWTEVLDEGNQPEAGSVIICFDCGAVRVLEPDGAARQMTVPEQKEFFDDTPEMARLVTRLQARYLDRGRHG